MGTEIENVNNELDAMMLAMDGDDNKAIMELTGQAESDTKPQTGLPRLNINYKEEDDNGTSLKRGTWSVWNGKARVVCGCCTDAAFVTDVRVVSVGPRRR